jgi:predicted RNase H-like nuclease (RuvC/YqgF family)
MSYAEDNGFDAYDGEDFEDLEDEIEAKDKRIEELQAKCDRLEKALEELYCQAATIIGECEDFASACEGGDSVQIFDICQNWLTEFGERKKQALKGE